MNIAYYGHNRTLVELSANGDKFVMDAVAAGIKLIEENCKRAIDDALAGGSSVQLGMKEDDSNDEYRRDYYEVSHTGNIRHNRYIGHKEGTIADNIYYSPPNADVPCDMLVVLDEGFGALDVPVEQTNPKTVLWASNKNLPDTEQFAKVADRCFLLLDANVLRNAGAMISRQISWERSASELIEELQVISEFRHGARAMEAILDASRNTPQSWEPSMLPFASQLGLYVDADEFLELVRR